MSQLAKFKDLKILGRNISIDFNTIDWRGRENPYDYITSYDDLVDWATHTRLVDKKEASMLKENASKNPEKALELYERTMSFREAVYRTLCCLSNSENLEVEDKELIEAEMRQMFCHLSLDLVGRQLELNYEIDLDQVLNLIVKDAVELLTSEELKKVKRCHSEECGWLFVDTSKNNSRKWCQMNGCSNRAKARRHYRRLKQ